MSDQEGVIPSVEEAVGGLAADERDSLALLVSLGAAVLRDAVLGGELSSPPAQDLALALPVLWALAPDEAEQAELLLTPLREDLAESLPDGLVGVSADAVRHCQGLLESHGAWLTDEQVRDGISGWLLGHDFLAQVAAVDSTVVGEPFARAVLEQEVGCDLEALPFTDRYMAAVAAVRR